MKILHSTSNIPSENAALEEYLYRNAEGETLLFYDNSPSVVIGRNQNPWKEADLEWCGRNGIRLARRISGGGAVYHDQGNLNYAYFVPRADFEPAQTVGRVAQVLTDLGIPHIRQDEHHSIFAGTGRSREAPSPSTARGPCFTDASWSAPTWTCFPWH